MLVGLALAAITILNLGVLRQRGVTQESAVAAASPESAIAAAGPGLVEPQSEEVRVSAQIGGRLERVLVDEGQRVKAGQVLAIIDNRDYQARVGSAHAELGMREAERRRVVNGARTQERQEAAAALAEAEAVLENAQAERIRRQTLLRERVVSRAEADETDRAERVAPARTDAARQRFELIDADAREEDQARADSDVKLARARLDEARAVYEKTAHRFHRQSTSPTSSRRVARGVRTGATQRAAPQQR